MCLYAIKKYNIESLLFQCQTLNEEEIFEVQDSLSLFPLGWIHVSLAMDPIWLLIICCLIVLN